MTADRGDMFSQLLHKLGIPWKSETQWFWVRSALHVFAGSAIGWATIWYVPLYSLSGGLLVGAIIFKEWQEAGKQRAYKTAWDPIFWIIPFLVPWVLVKG